MSTLNEDHCGYSDVLDRAFGLQSQSEKDSSFEVGDLVYSAWPENEDYYWGRIQQKFKKDTNATFYTYAIKFEDGDFLKETTSKDLHSLVEYNELVANGSINRDESQGFDGAPVEDSNDSTCMEVTTDEDMSTTMTQMEDPPSTASSQIQTASKKRDACELDLAEDDTKCNARQRTMLTPTPTAARLVSPPESTKPVPVEQVCMKTGRVLLQFSSQTEAARSVNGANQRISGVMDRENKSYMGYVWRRQRRLDSDECVCMEVVANEEMPPTKTQVEDPPSSASNKTQTSLEKRDADGLEPEDDSRKPEARCDETDYQEMHDDKTDHQEMYDDDDDDDDDTDYQEMYDETEDQERFASPPPKVASVSLATASVMATAGFICGACVMFAAIIILV